MYRFMKYILNAFWKHDTPINAEEAIDYIMIIRDNLDNDKHVLETILYQIDEYTLGSVAIYKSEESYFAFLEKNTFQREFSNKENGVIMLEEYKGPAYAVQTELPEERTA